MPEIPSRLTTALADRYRIERELGTGGMAVVYLAHDIRHDRPVALKVLKPELSAVLGADRFITEIRTTASLQHPHILPLFDSGNADGLLFYVMPYIDGETLRSRLDRETQLGVDEAVRIATEVADALDYAHRRGVIHRDIKPENILLHDGRPMVADFGIALAVSAAAGGRMTETGLSLGTPHYMSPEQATADKDITGRSDIYSLATVLYEMLTGDPPHTGSSAQAIIMKIITDRPREVAELRRTVTPNVAAAVMKALEKLPADRFDSAKSFVDALRNPSFTTASAAGPATAASAGARSTSRVAFGSAVAVAAIATLAAAAGWMRPAPAPPSVIRYSDAQIGEELFATPGNSLSISPDGQLVAYTAGASGSVHIRMRARNALSSTPLPDTDAGLMPTFSPDGQRLAFCTRNQGIRTCTWRVMPVSSGMPVTLAVVPGPIDGSTWSDDGNLYVSGADRALVRVPEAGGSHSPFTKVDLAAGERGHRYPDALPDGRGVLFIVQMATGVESSEVAVADPTGAHRRLGIRALAVRYATTGHLVYVTTAGDLIVAPFDVKRLELTGESRMAGQMQRFEPAGGVNIDISANGTLVYATSTEARLPDELAWVERDGTTRTSGEPWLADFGDLALSPDGTRVAAGVRLNGVVEQWVRTGETGPMSKLTFATDGSASEPAWTPDGRSIAYVLTTDPLRARTGDIAGVERDVFIRRADGSAPAEPLFSWRFGIDDIAWSPDSTLLFVARDSSGDRNIMAIRPGVDQEPRQLVATTFAEHHPAVSPDGQWLAHVSGESGRGEVYVRPFRDPLASRTQVSSQGGNAPGWSSNGRELFYVRRTGGDEPQGELVSVDVVDGPTFAFGNERVLFTQRRNIDYWGVTPDSRRFVVIRGAPQTAESERSVIIVVNWFEELRAVSAR